MSDLNRKGTQILHRLYNMADGRVGRVVSDLSDTSDTSDLSVVSCTDVLNKRKEDELVMNEKEDCRLNMCEGKSAPNILNVSVNKNMEIIHESKSPNNVLDMERKIDEMYRMLQLTPR